VLFWLSQQSFIVAFMTRIMSANTPAARAVFRIAAMGARAVRALRGGGQGEVSAVFERSFYVVVNGQWICLVPQGGGLGPLNAQCAESSLVEAIKKLRMGDSVFCESNSLRIGTLTFSFDRAATWKADAPAGWDERSVAQGLDRLRQEIYSRELPKEGLAQFLQSRVIPSTAVAKAAQAPLQNLRALLQPAIVGNEAKIDALLPLIGLGPGLTPSGDDVIGGALIALHLLGEDRARDVLWTALRPHAKTATGDVSFAHLEAAAEGLGHEAIHQIANDLMTGGDTMREKLDAVHAIGHTSGWDALAGIVAVLEAWLAVRAER
jgi:hypothetical protein